MVRGGGGVSSRVNEWLEEGAGLVVESMNG